MVQPKFCHSRCPLGLGPWQRGWDRCSQDSQTLTFGVPIPQAAGMKCGRQSSGRLWVQADHPAFPPIAGQLELFMFYYTLWGLVGH